MEPLDQDLDGPILTDPEAGDGQTRVPASEMVDTVLELESLGVVVDRIPCTVVVGHKCESSRSVESQRNFEVADNGGGGRVVRRRQVFDDPGSRHRVDMRHAESGHQEVAHGTLNPPVHTGEDGSKTRICHRRNSIALFGAGATPPLSRRVEPWVCGVGRLDAVEARRRWWPGEGMGGVDACNPGFVASVVEAP